MNGDILELIKLAQNGDEKAVEIIIEENSGLIWSVVRRFLNRGYDAEDLYQIGSIGLLKCIKKFDTNYEVKFSTYAVPMIMGEIKRFLRDDGMIKVSRQIKELLVKINKIKSDYEKSGKTITVEEIAKILNVSKEEIAASLNSSNNVESLYDKEDEDGLCLIDKIKSSGNEEENTINRLALKEGINRLKPREKEIIFLRYYKCQTQKDVARTMGISQVQVCRIEKQILNILYEELKEA